MSLSKIGKGEQEKKRVNLRRNYIEKKVDINLNDIAAFSLDPQMVAGKNCENMIGVTQVPLGVAGPIKIKTIRGNEKEYYLPLATTEGALVASVSRGCKAITLAGGTQVRVKKRGISRAPVFEVKDLEQADELIHWANQNISLLKQVTRATDQYIRLESITPFLSGKLVFLRFVYDTHEAMGMNMATIATQKITEIIQAELDISCLSLSGNMCVDKKPCWLNFILGRGMSVWAEVKLQKEIVQQILKTTPEKIYSVVLGKNMVGSHMSGSLGFNAHFANVIAAFFIATGQDPAHVVEGSLGTTSAQIEKNGDLYFSVYLPSVILGTVGGGTGLKTQKEALKLLGLGMGKKDESLELAYIVGSAVLAGELSLIAALSANHLAKAHVTLARGKKND